MKSLIDKLMLKFGYVRNIPHRKTFRYCDKDYTLTFTVDGVKIGNISNVEFMLKPDFSESSFSFSKAREV